MSDETPETETLLDEDAEMEVYEDKVVAPRKRGPGYPIFILGLIAASLLGAAGGGAAAYYLRQNTATPAPMQAEVTELQSQMAKLERSRTQTEQALKSRPNNKVDLSEITARLEALETAPPPKVDMSQIDMSQIAAPGIDPDILTRLEALQGEGSAALDLSDMKTRLESLESAGMPEDLRAEVQNLFERLAEWEIRLDDFRTEIRSDMTDIRAELDAVPVAPIAPTPPKTVPFPKAAIIAALDAQTEQTGLLNRALSKHIRVKDNDDPLVLIDAIEVALDRGDMRTAREKFDRLPSPARSAGQAWRDSLN